MNSKVFIAALVGALAHFLLGWVIYGMLLMDIMSDGMTADAATVTRGEEEMFIWSFGIASFALSLLIALLYFRMGIRSFGKGAIAGLWIGALLAIAIDFNLYAQFNLTSMDIILVDVIAVSVLMVLTGGVIGLMLGMRDKKTVTT